MTTFPEAVRIQLKNLCGILNDGPDADTMARVRQVAVALSSLCACEGVGGHPVPAVDLPTRHVALHEALLARTREDRAAHLAAGHLVTGRTFGKGDALETMKRLIEEQHRAEMSKAVVESTLCRSQSPSSDADDPPVTCSRERGHDGQHEGGCRGGTASWDSTEEPAPVNCGSCHTCLDGLAKMTMMVLCITCGNKRCPRANDHNNECSGSNSPGQKGSAYE